ncbi:hypothetical protein [Sphingobium sp. CCH11-B1]|uniref:hypothetical protein n=1 Tax=Sphingobium sp. CCH11-B1 TaxID=1768781 RepID=UPI00082F29F5|nr:hypothetical protein [Sphingobium sp. CCH11-B1]
MGEHDIFYGVECRHHYGITIKPCEAGVDIAAVAYNEMRETHHFLTDDNHEWSVEWGDCWNAIIVRKNDKSGYFAFNPWHMPDGPGAFWFRHSFRMATRNRVNAEVADHLRWAEKWRGDALRNKGSKAGVKRFLKTMSLAEDMERQARLAMKRWPHHVGFIARLSIERRG